MHKDKKKCGPRHTKDSLPFPLSCLVNQRSSGHSWGRLGLCTRLCETVARCLSALQTPCWQTTAAAERHDTQESRHVTRSSHSVHQSYVSPLMWNAQEKKKATRRWEASALYLSFTCLTVVKVTQVEDLQVQRGNFQILQEELRRKETTLQQNLTDVWQFRIKYEFKCSIVLCEKTHPLTSRFSHVFLYKLIWLF